MQLAFRQAIPYMRTSEIGAPSHLVPRTTYKYLSTVLYIMSMYYTLCTIHYVYEPSAQR